MPFWVYILQSESTGRYYAGQTDHLERRLSEHNDPGYMGSKTTKRFKGPWKVIWTMQVATRSEAMILEKVVKKRGIGRFLETSVGRVPL
ncbi:MAG: GIY-YIG nuclease family protein [Deltaproteobacteria bacterium]|nr:GIY-YIG nuclease family protein [Deltaproteobacteria bacterium]